MLPRLILLINYFKGNIFLLILAVVLYHDDEKLLQDAEKINQNFNLKKREKQNLLMDVGNHSPFDVLHRIQDHHHSWYLLLFQKDELWEIKNKYEIILAIENLIVEYVHSHHLRKIEINRHEIFLLDYLHLFYSFVAH
jgi:hypothetical protein